MKKGFCAVLILPLPLFAGCGSGGGGGSQPAAKLTPGNASQAANVVLDGLGLLGTTDTLGTMGGAKEIPSAHRSAPLRSFIQTALAMAGVGENGDSREG